MAFDTKELELTLFASKCSDFWWGSLALGAASLMRLAMNGGASASGSILLSLLMAALGMAEQGQLVHLVEPLSCAAIPLAVGLHVLWASGPVALCAAHMLLDCAELALLSSFVQVQFRVALIPILLAFLPCWYLAAGRGISHPLAYTAIVQLCCLVPMLVRDVLNRHRCCCDGQKASLPWCTHPDAAHVSKQAESAPPGGSADVSLPCSSDTSPSAESVGFSPSGVAIAQKLLTVPPHVDDHALRSLENWDRVPLKLKQSSPPSSDLQSVLKSLAHGCPDALPVTWQSIAGCDAANGLLPDIFVSDDDDRDTCSAQDKARERTLFTSDSFISSVTQASSLKSSDMCSIELCGAIYDDIRDDRFVDTAKQGMEDSGIDKAALVAVRNSYLGTYKKCDAVRSPFAAQGSNKYMSPGMAMTLEAIRRSICSAAAEHQVVHIILPWSDPSDFPEGALSSVAQGLASRHPGLSVRHSIMRRGSAIISLDVFSFNNGRGTGDVPLLAILSAIPSAEWFEWMNMPLPEHGASMIVQVGSQRHVVHWNALAKQWQAGALYLPGCQVSKEHADSGVASPKSVTEAAAAEMIAAAAAPAAAAALPCFSMSLGSQVLRLPDCVAGAAGDEAHNRCQVVVMLTAGCTLVPLHDRSFNDDTATVLRAWCQGRQVPLTYKRGSVMGLGKTWLVDLDFSATHAAVLMLEAWRGHMMVGSARVLCLPASLSAVAAELELSVESAQPVVANLSVLPAPAAGSRASEWVDNLGMWLQYIAELPLAEPDVPNAEGLQEQMRSLGMRLLSTAIIKGCVSTAELLVTGLTDASALGLSFETICRGTEGGVGDSPLHLAVLSGQACMVAAVLRMALEHGCPLSWEVENDAGVTPLHLLAYTDPDCALLKVLFATYQAVHMVWHICRGGLNVTPAQVAWQLALSAPPSSMDATRSVTGNVLPSSSAPTLSTLTATTRILTIPTLNAPVSPPVALSSPPMRKRHTGTTAAAAAPSAATAAPSSDAVVAAPRPPGLTWLQMLTPILPASTDSPLVAGQISPLPKQCTNTTAADAPSAAAAAAAPSAVALITAPRPPGLSWLQTLSVIAHGFSEKDVEAKFVLFKNRHCLSHLKSNCIMRLLANIAMASRMFWMLRFVSSAFVIILHVPILLTLRALTKDSMHVHIEASMASWMFVRALVQALAVWENAADAGFLSALVLDHLSSCWAEPVKVRTAACLHLLNLTTHVVALGACNIPNYLAKSICGHLAALTVRTLNEARLRHLFANQEKLHKC